MKHFLIRISLAAIGILLSISASFANELRLDQTYGAAGITKLSFGSGTSWVSTGVVQSNEKVIVAGSIGNGGYSSIALTRIDADGVFDESFGNRGVVVTKLGVNSRTEAVGLMPDGRIVLAGWAYVEKKKNGIVLAMYQADGRLDSSFGDQGIVVFPVEYSDAYAYALAVQKNGQILVGGRAITHKVNKDGFSVLTVPTEHFLLARLNSDGSFDSAFGNNGVVVTEVGDGASSIRSLTLQADGKIIASGKRNKGASDRGAIPAESEHILVRYNKDGTLDSRFGVSGLVRRLEGVGAYTDSKISLSYDDRIYLIGGYSQLDEHWLVLSRLAEDGSPDLSYGEKGRVTKRTKTWTPATFLPAFPVLLPNKEVLIAGSAVRPPKRIGSSPAPYYFSIGTVHHKLDGSEANAVVEDDVCIVSPGEISDKPAFVTVQNSGRIVVVGQTADRNDWVGQQIVLIGLVAR